MHKEGKEGRRRRDKNTMKHKRRRRRKKINKEVEDNQVSERKEIG